MNWKFDNVDRRQGVLVLGAVLVVGILFFVFVLWNMELAQRIEVLERAEQAQPEEVLFVGERAGMGARSRASGARVIVQPGPDSNPALVHPARHSNYHLPSPKPTPAKAKQK